MKKRLHVKQFGFEGKKGVAAVTMVQTSDGRLGFFHQVFDTESNAKSIRNGHSKPVYIDGELNTAEINAVKSQFCEKLSPSSRLQSNCSAIITNHKD